MRSDPPVPRQAGGRGGRRSGGRWLEWIDKVGYAAAAGWSGSYCVTAYVGTIHLERPIAVAELVELHAKFVYTGRSSMHILVRVYFTDPTELRPIQSARCLTIFVAIDDNRAPTPVPQWTPTIIASYFGGIRFYRPLSIGRVVESTARLIHTGLRSMHFSVHLTGMDPHGNTATRPHWPRTPTPCSSS